MQRSLNVIFMLVVGWGCFYSAADTCRMAFLFDYNNPKTNHLEEWFIYLKPEQQKEVLKQLSPPFTGWALQSETNKVISRLKEPVVWVRDFKKSFNSLSHTKKMVFELQHAVSNPDFIKKYKGLGGWLRLMRDYEAGFIKLHPVKVRSSLRMDQIEALAWEDIFYFIEHHFQNHYYTEADLCYTALETMNLMNSRWLVPKDRHLKAAHAILHEHASQPAIEQAQQRRWALGLPFNF